ncbi:mannose-6-phosphate isomerase, class I [Pseudarthrobacter sp. J1763]|uniref:mannose-6-phosphate isomerase, class I n=1 Tax=Pseudarthrobacter sp. J1763 TaxID=3420445 RepID=UPI003D26F2BE
MYRIKNTVRAYAWGSATAISQLLGTPASGGPEAEMWIGAHPDSPSTVVLPDGGSQGLDALLAEDPTHHLGEASIAAFGDRLPFLMKVLAAETPLSLQVHPSLEQAREGFAREEATGVDRGAPERNYKDNNHKPEMIFALTDFEALCGFRSPAASAAIFSHVRTELAAMGAKVPGLLDEVIGDLAGADEAVALRSAFTRLITGGDRSAALVGTVVAALTADLPRGQFGRELDTAKMLDSHYPGDPGVLISLLLNRVSLRPGESVYLPAGNVHAYLHGLGIEVMAASDNVLRGGLTPKFVDVPELLRTVKFEAVGVPMLAAEESFLAAELYRPPFEEFALQLLELPAADSTLALEQAGAAVILVASGALILDSPKGSLRLERGESAFVPNSDAPVNIHSVAPDGGTTVAFAVTTGLGN